MLGRQNVSAPGGGSALNIVSQVAERGGEMYPTQLVRRPGARFFSSLCPLYRSKTHLYTRGRF
jgi:hypothetical protein